MNIQDMIHFYGTKNINETHAFYTEILGLKMSLDQGKCQLYECREHSYVGFCEHLEVLNTYKSPILTFVLDDIDGMYSHLMKNWVVNEPPSINEKFQLYHFFILDNNGYTIEFQRFLNPRWNQTNF